MSYYIAKIENGIVSQVVVVGDDYELAEDEALIGRENTVGIGWSFDGWQFAPPEVEVEA